jgi:hypothetical protein
MLGLKGNIMTKYAIDTKILGSQSPCQCGQLRPDLGQSKGVLADEHSST